MNGLHRLIGEIHRRSLWQVLGIYVAASWAVLGAVGTLGDVLGLPDWFPRLALGLLIVGLPAVLATAVVQEGGPGALWAADADGAPADGPGARILTWRNVTVAGVLAFAAWGVVAAAWVAVEGNPAARDDEARSVAVLPFVNMSGDPDNEYFSDGITEEILNALVRIPGLRVPGRTSSFSFKGRNIPIPEVAATLGVEHVLEGSVRRDGGRVRVTAQLVDAGTDTHLWSAQWDRDLTDIFLIQSEIAAAIADQLQVRFGGGEALVPAATADLDAYDLYLRGRSAYANRGRGDRSSTGSAVDAATAAITAPIDLASERIDEALAYYEQALALDPDFALAHAGAAEAWAVRFWYGGDLDVDLANAEAEARAALALDESLAVPWLVLANVARDRRDWATAEALYGRVLERLASYGETHHEYGEYLLNVGRCEESVAAQERALDLDPLSIVFPPYLVYALMCAGRVEEAVDRVEPVLADMRQGRIAVGNNPIGRFGVLAFLEVGRPDEAVATAEVVGSAWRLAVAEAVRDGSPPDARALGVPISSAGAWAASILGDREHALRALERCSEEPCGTFAWIGMPAVRRLLAGDPRYEAALARMGLDAGEP